MRRYDWTDFEWRVIEPLLPDQPRGAPRVDDRAANFLTMVKLASMRLWLRAYESTA
jgi:transposase